MKRLITGFHLDRFQEWAADLECGHAIRMQHNPPYQYCSWVGSAKGRQEHIGDLQECVNCEMPMMPDSLVLFETSSLYQKESIPDNFISNYVVDAGVWAKIVIKKGLLQFLIDPNSKTQPVKGFVLDENLCGIIAPGIAHDVKPAMGDVEFFVEFYREIECSGQEI